MHDGSARPPGRTPPLTGTDLTILLAIGAGLLSFLSPCVLPLVPAYIGQLTAVAVADARRHVGDGSTAGTATLTRWTALRHAIAYVLGFGAVFTLLGVTATFAAAGLSAFMPILRQLGGALLILLGLNLAGVLLVPRLSRSWRPLDQGAAASVATTSGSIALAPTRGPGLGDRIGGRLVTGRGGWLASFGLGAIFAIGWTPCVGVILGGILGLASSSATLGQGAILLVAYTAGLGVPFVTIALFYDRAPNLLRPFIRRGRLIEVIGGLLVVLIGVAMVFNWLALMPRWFQFNTAI
ncbi:MAG TPA: cytochrome c biogenesis protein CcdA [Patescibacteria group bacterium]|nr:cytochrome c biogenesis protein CcdA [Patescibacteria group bacterium]